MGWQKEPGFEGLGLEGRVFDQLLVSVMEGGEGVDLVAFSGGGHVLDVGSIGGFVEKVVDPLSFGGLHGPP